MPSTARAANHSTMIGPNMPPTRAVPRRWMANNATIMPSVIGSTVPAKVRIEQLEPLDGGGTEIAGVISASQ